MGGLLFNGLERGTALLTPMGKKKDSSSEDEEEKEESDSEDKKKKKPSKNDKKKKKRKQDSDSDSPVPLKRVRKERSKSRSDSSDSDKRVRRKAPEKKPAAPAAGASKEVPDWLKDLMPSGSAGGPAVPRPASKPVIIPQHLVNLLTSNGEEIIRKIAAASGVDISLRQDTQHLGYSIAVVSGGAAEIVSAEEMLKQQLGLGGGNSITKEIDVHGEYLNAILGPNGLTLADIRQKAGGVQIDLKATGRAVRFIIGPGALVHVTTAEQLIRRKVTETELDMLSRRNRGPVQGLPARLPPGGQLPCMYFAQGHCVNGPACQFAHARTDGLPEKKLPCKLYLRGLCDRGQGCLFSHAEIPGAPSPPAAAPEPKALTSGEEPKKESSSTSMIL